MKTLSIFVALIMLAIDAASAGASAPQSDVQEMQLRLFRTKLANSWS